MGKVITEFDLGWPGAISRSVDDIVISMKNNSTEPIPFGVPVFLSSDGSGVEPFANTDSGFVFFRGVLEILGHINRLAEIDHGRGAETEVVAVFESVADFGNCVLFEFCFHKRQRTAAIFFISFRISLRDVSLRAVCILYFV